MPNVNVAGDAPKDYIRIYEFGHGRRSNKHTWPAHIAKVGHKYYPNESITEHLLTRIGQEMGMAMADSQLMWFGRQLRFLSRYFLDQEREQLVHGAEIFAGYLQDRNFVEEVEAADQSRNLFTFQFVEDALLDRFGDQAEELLRGFVRLIAFDAIVGNNDRHYYNWGVITDLARRKPPRFSPVYDTARALFWNTTDAVIEKIASDHRRETWMRKYIDRCFPKIGWDGNPVLNHFGLIREISRNRPGFRHMLAGLCPPRLAATAADLIESEFHGMITAARSDFICECLDRRATMFHEALAE
ncbi:MAG: HipA domain-containing protein [Verrucomicrobiae bacterium]|nr:HipA domain-containing protein [Verrucomicrobiae bacterium]MCP5545007.1 HipA domain-containing protein [Akkermansiaceae bacterium]